MCPAPLFHTDLQATLHHRAPVDRVFPLLCPVQEALWLPGWSAQILHSDSGVAELGCVFRTRDAEDCEHIWIVSRYEPAAGLIQFVQFLPGRCVLRLDIAVAPEPGGCRSHWNYTVDGLVPAPPDGFAAYAQAPFSARMAHLETSLASYLATSR
jgi:hypothetical protein